jgi:hypothetical protein
MKKTIFIVTVLAISLAACAPPATPAPATEPVSAPVEDNMPVPGMDVTETVVQGKMPAPSFESQTYINEAVGFALEYPAGWTVQESVIGDRGSQTLLLSSPEIAELATIPAGATRVAVNVNQWDPKNDLAAFVENRKTAWEASGFSVLTEEPLTLDLGLSAVRLTVQSPEGVSVEYLLAAVGDQYVTISGEGDLALVKEIMRYLRPINN